MGKWLMIRRVSGRKVAIFKNHLPSSRHEEIESLFLKPARPARVSRRLEMVSPLIVAAPGLESRQGTQISMIVRTPATNSKRGDICKNFGIVKQLGWPGMEPGISGACRSRISRQPEAAL